MASLNGSGSLIPPSTPASGSVWHPTACPTPLKELPALPPPLPHVESSPPAHPSTVNAAAAAALEVSFPDPGACEEGALLGAAEAGAEGGGGQERTLHDTLRRGGASWCLTLLRGLHDSFYKYMISFLCQTRSRSMPINLSSSLDQVVSCAKGMAYAISAVVRVRRKLFSPRRFKTYSSMPKTQDSLWKIASLSVYCLRSSVPKTWPKTPFLH